MMKIILLSAGKRSSLVPLKDSLEPHSSSDYTKTFLNKQLQSLELCQQFSEVTFILGFKAENYLPLINASKLKNKVIYNPQWKNTKNFSSLYLAKKDLDCDFMICNGDLLFHPSIFSSFFPHQDGIYLACYKKEFSSFTSQDRKVKINQKGLIHKISKELPFSETTYVSPGLCCIRGKKARNAFKEAMEELSQEDIRSSFDWFEVLNKLAQSGFAATPQKLKTQHIWLDLGVPSQDDKVSVINDKHS
jgi:choline kinase